MQKLTKPTFAVFFYPVKENAKVVRRQYVILRRFLTTEPESGIKIIDYASLAFGFCMFVIIAEADSREILELALEHCKGNMQFSIVPVEKMETSALRTEKRYAVFVKSDETSKKHFTRNPANLCEVINLQTRAEFENDSSILLLEASSASQARQYGEYLYPQSKIFVTPTRHPESLFKNPEPALSETVLPATSLSENAAADSGFSIFNEGTSAVQYVPESLVINGSQTELDYYSLFKNLLQISPQTAASLNTGCYLWSASAGSFDFTWEYAYDPELSPNGGGKIQPFSMQSNALPPKLYSEFTPGAPLGFNIADNDGFHCRTAQYFWLNDILNKTTADFPENSYTGNDLAAYNYFLEQLSGVAPDTGTVASSYMQSILDKGCPPNIDKTSFDNVGAHLVKECSLFETVDKWFGIGGIFSVINGQIAQVAANDLKEAAALMQIQETSNITTTLDSFFSILESLVGMIPGAGPFIRGAITIGWTTAKLSMSPGIGNAPIEESIANMAKKINTYLNNMVTANIKIHETIKKNWGKLKAFTDGTMGNNAMISEDQFDITYNGSGNVQLPQSYLDAADKAWRLTAYQTLFAGFHTPNCGMSLQDSKPVNPWNPDAGNYDYIYYLDTVTTDKNGNKQAAFMEFGCRTDAPTEVLQKLFGSNSEFNLNPLVFFTGINGWTVQNIYYQGVIDGTRWDMPASNPNFSALGILV